MTNKSVWYPQKSIANDGSEEGGRGSLVDPQPTDLQLETKRKKARIPHRRTPTVDVSALVRDTAAGKRHSVSDSKRKSKARDTYDTIESKDGLSILECSSVVYRKNKPQVNNTSLDGGLCGWRENELESYREAADRGLTSSSFDRSRLQTPAEGLRSNLHSRASRSRQSSSHGKRKECYIFQHFEETHQYIEHYHVFHAFTTLNVPGLRRKMCTGETISEDFHEGKLPPEPKDVEQDPESFMQPGVKSYCHTHGDPYLRELVSRLGVRELIMQREQQLLRSPTKPTPPSITKKNTPQEELVVCSNGKRYVTFYDNDVCHEMYVYSQSCEYKISTHVYRSEEGEVPLPNEHINSHQVT